MLTRLVEFESYLKADGKSPKTIESYAGDVREFLKYLQHEGRGSGH